MTDACFILRPSLINAASLHGSDVVPILPAGSMGSLEIDYVKLPAWHQPKPHIHRNTDHFIVVMRGFGELILGDRRQEIWGGHTAFIPRGVPHAFFTRADTLEFYAMRSPASTESLGKHAYAREEVIGDQTRIGVDADA